MFEHRAYNNFEVDKNNPSLIIKSSEEKRLLDEYAYYESLPTNLKFFFPRTLPLVTIPLPDGKNLYKMSMEYYAYDNLGKVMLEKLYVEKFWSKIFSGIFEFIEKCKEHKITNDRNILDCDSMYVIKTEREQRALCNSSHFFSDLNKEDFLNLNGEKLLNFNVIWPKIKSYIKSNFYTDSFNYIHGDMCFSNIMYGVHPKTEDTILKFIDPRGSFGDTKFYGDSYYDLAKISHSVNGGYEYFINDNFSIVQSDRNSFSLSFWDEQNNFFTKDVSLLITHKDHVKDLFCEMMKDRNYDSMKIKTLEGTIFVGMCARHYDSFSRQQAMYLTGLKLLNEVYRTL